MGHLIHRQILELKFNRQEDAQRCSARFSELNQRIILPELERVFSALAKDRTLRIDRLEIDLGRLQQADLEHDLAALVGRKVEEALQPYLQLGETPGGGRVDSPVPVEANARSRTAEQALDAASLTELFTEFLHTGTLPWWLSRELATRLDMLYQRFWQLAPEAATRLLTQTIAEPAGLLRVIEQFSTRSQQLTLQKLLPQGNGALLADLCKLATQLLRRQGMGLQARTVSLKLAYGLLRGSSQPAIERPQVLVRRFLAALAQAGGLPLAQLLEQVDGAVARLRMSSAGRMVLAELLREPESLFDLKGGSRPQIAVADPEFRGAEDEPVTTAAAREVVIENAGLVLLWPHLKELFNKLELLERRCDGVQQPKLDAVLLLQQLVTGRPTAQENLLLLNKLLCGVPPTVPVPRRRRRTAGWDAAVEELLTVVINQWAALKNTSVSGLRSGFLQREGVLRQQERGWLLQVERKSHDILLEYLPWGLGMVQFSWMRQPLQIDW